VTRMCIRSPLDRAAQPSAGRLFKHFSVEAAQEEEFIHNLSAELQKLAQSRHLGSPGRQMNERGLPKRVREQRLSRVRSQGFIQLQLCSELLGQAIYGTNFFLQISRQIGGAEHQFAVENNTGERFP
jgi:hypothetical protein